MIKLVSMSEPETTARELELFYRIRERILVTWLSEKGVEEEK